MPCDAANIPTRCGKLKVKKERSTYQAYKDFLLWDICIYIYIFMIYLCILSAYAYFFSSTFETLYRFVIYFSGSFLADSMLAEPRATCVVTPPPVSGPTGL